MKFCDTDKNWERSLWCDMRFYLQDNMLVKVDRASMLHSLEVRIPFLDHNVVDYIARVPSSLKYKGNISKYILKKVAAKHLPNKIINRKKKGFGIPVAKWIKKDMRNMFEETFYGYDNNSEFFNKKYLRTLLKDHLDNKKDNRKLLWTLFIYIKWSEKNL
jgi:asparagine synthase (glutamine-hydrolysing)